jgi:hypothetical protein
VLRRDDTRAEERTERAKRSRIDSKLRRLKIAFDEHSRALARRQKAEQFSAAYETASRNAHKAAPQILPAVEALITDPGLGCHEEASTAVARMHE